MGNQFQIYSIDTEAFYNKGEERINRQRINADKKKEIIKEYTLYAYLQEKYPDEYTKYTFKSLVDYYKQQRKPIVKKNDNGEYISSDAEKEQYKNSVKLRKYIDKLVKENKEFCKEKDFKNLLMQNKIYYHYMHHDKKQGEKKQEKNLIEKLQSQLNNVIENNKNTRQLNPKKINPYNIVSMFDGSLSRTLELKADQTTEDLFVIRIYHYPILNQLLHKGFDYNHKHYVFFTASAGQIRKKKIMMIEEEIFNKYTPTLMCGLTIKDINNSEQKGCNANKFLAYLALLMSNTEKWTNFNIDHAIVIDDFETNVLGTVDYIDNKTFEITPNKQMEVPITHSDGCGWILPSKSKKNFQFRMPWFKGLLTPVNYLLYCDTYNNNNYKVNDIYGKEWDLKADDIWYVFSKSQFKMYKYYPNKFDNQGNIIKYGWDTYKENFKTYNCTANICNEEPDDFDDKNFNYQMWQSLNNVKDEDIKIFTNKIKDFITKAYTDRDTMLNIMGADKENTNKNYLQQALEIYPELLRKVKDNISSVISSTKNDAKYAKFKIDCKYTFIIPDVFAWMQFVFNKETKPKGLLNDGETFCRLYKNVSILDVCRSPHLFKEHAVRKNIVDDDKKDWFVTDGIYTSCHDLISKILQFDNDGDHAIVVAEKEIVNLASESMKGVNPLYYVMGKADAVEINADNLYKSLTNGFKYSNIGTYSNKITTLWNKSNFTDDTLKAIKILTAQNNFSIDSAKTLMMPTLPKEVNALIQKELKGTKLPYFFQFNKDKDEKNVEPMNDSTVNKICRHIEDIKQGDFEFKGISLCRYDTMMHNKEIVINDDVINKYKTLEKYMNKYFYKSEEMTKGQMAGSVYNRIRNEFYNFCKINNIPYNDAVDMVIVYIYTHHKYAHNHQTFLFRVCGGVIVNNLKNNIKKSITDGTYILCADCGKRIKKKSNRQKYCPVCEEKRKAERNKNRKK